MEKANKSKLPAGAIVALAACAILIAALAWRFAGSEDGESGLAASGAAQMSTPQSLDDLRAAAQAAPQDSQAWQQLAFAYFSANMFAEAVDAYDHATQIAPESAVLWSSLGEARVMASEDEPMPQAALAAFRRALSLDSADPRARYFMAVQKDLSGDHEGAITDWLALLADTPAGAPWENDLMRTVQQVGTLRDIEVTQRIADASATRNILPALPPATPPGNLRGPTQQDLAAASRIPPSEQQAMAEGMVASLAARMESEPGNVGGWIMLMRSYRTLERMDDARSAYRRALAANPQARDELEAAAQTLGLD